MGGSRQTQTTSQQSNPWAPAQPLLNDVLRNAQQYGNDPSMWRPQWSDSTRAGIAGMERQAGQQSAQNPVLQGLVDGGMEGYGVANKALMDTASGGSLAGNPYLNDMLKTSTGRAADAVNAQFSGAGRFGSASHAGVLADRLGGIETGARFENYNNERQRQLAAAGVLQDGGYRAAGFAGQIDQNNAAQNQMMLQAGAMRDQMANAERTAPMNATQWMAGLGTSIGGMGGTSSGTTESRTPSNIPGMILGGGMTALGAMTGNPMMAMGGLSGLSGAAAGGAGGMPAWGMSGGGLGGLGGWGGRSVYNDPGSMANGGWSTNASTPSWMSGLGNWWGGR